MSDKLKLKLISELIESYYEVLYSGDDKAEQVGALEQLIDSILHIAQFNVRDCDLYLQEEVS